MAYTGNIISCHRICKSACFRKNFRRRGKGEPVFKPHGAGHAGNNLPVWQGLAGWGDGLPGQRHGPVGIHLYSVTLCQSAPGRRISAYWPVSVSA